MKEEILKLKNGEHYTVPESDYGKAEIWRINNNYFVFSIPMYGGEPRFEERFNEKDEDSVVKLINSWT